MTLQPGEHVRIVQNDARVKPGSEGRYVGIAQETGNLLVDVDGRGRVSFTRDSVVSMNGAAATVAQRAASNGTPQPEKIKLSRALYLDGADTAAELGVTLPILAKMREALDVGQCSKRMCKYTLREIGMLLRFRDFMRRTKQRNPAIAYSILSEVREMTGRDPLAPE